MRRGAGRGPGPKNHWPTPSARTAATPADARAAQPTAMRIECRARPVSPVASDAANRTTVRSMPTFDSVLPMTTIVDVSRNAPSCSGRACVPAIRSSRRPTRARARGRRGPTPIPTASGGGPNRGSRRTYGGRHRGRPRRGTLGHAPIVRRAAFGATWHASCCRYSACTTEAVWFGRRTTTGGHGVSDVDRQGIIDGRLVHRRPATVVGSARHAGRRVVSRHPAVFMPIARKRHPQSALAPDTQIVIDGFTRSAGTFAFVGFSGRAERARASRPSPALGGAHHGGRASGAPGARSDPSAEGHLVFRGDPRAGGGIGQWLRTYCDFYRHLCSLGEDVAIATFEGVTAPDRNRDPPGQRAVRDLVRGVPTHAGTARDRLPPTRNELAARHGLTCSASSSPDASAWTSTRR